MLRATASDALRCDLHEQQHRDPGPAAALGSPLRPCTLPLALLLLLNAARCCAILAALFLLSAHNHSNIAILGLLLPSYSYTGMDGPCHMSEEVEGASMGPPKAILSGWAVMFVGGLSLVIALLFSITSIESVLSEDSPAGGNPVAQIMYDASMQRFGTPKVGIGLLVVVLLGVFFCCVATMTYVSR